MVRDPEDIGNWFEGHDNHLELWVEVEDGTRRLVATFENLTDLQRVINGIANTNLMIDNLEDKVIDLEDEIDNERP
jgi:hypothetical protein